MTPDPSPLDTATIEELIDELGRRHSAVIVCTVKDMPNRDGEDNAGAATYWRGGWINAIGLAEFLRVYIRRRLLNDDRDTDED